MKFTWCLIYQTQRFSISSPVWIGSIWVYIWIISIQNCAQ